MRLDRPGVDRHTAPTLSPRTRSRRSILLGAVVATAALSSCSLLGPADDNRPAPTRPSAPASSTPAPGSLFGILPQPAAPTVSPTPEPVLVRIAHWETGDTRAVFDTLMASFTQRNPNVVVRQDVQPFGDHFSRLLDGFAAGDPPDTFVSSGAHFYRHLTDSRLLDLLSHLTTAGLNLDDYWTDPTVRPINGPVYAVPLWSSVELAFLNRDHLDQAGAAFPPDDWTWPQLTALAEKLTLGKPGEIARWGLLLVNDLIGGWGSFIASNGGTWIDLEARKAGFDPAAVDALTWVGTAMNVRHVAPRPIEQQTLTQGGTIDPFLAGRVSILVNGSWELASALKRSPFRWDVARLPRAPRTKASVCLSGVQPGCAARVSRHPDQAWQLLGSLLTGDSQRRWSAGKIRLPALKSLAANVQDGFGTPPPQNAGVIAPAASSATDPRFTFNWQPFRSALINALEPAFNGQIDLRAAIQNAVSAGDVALRS